MTSFNFFPIIYSIIHPVIRRIIRPDIHPVIRRIIRPDVNPKTEKLTKLTVTEGVKTRQKHEAN